MRGEREDAETTGGAGLAVGLVLFGTVLVGLLTWIIWRGSGNLVLAFVVAVVPVAVSLAWLWSRMR
ncbi:hypothetical protein KTU01_31670 [Kocuria turfanensis]|uniref:Uncharacterized protein n=1 Tax=Kocuria turfanensis TaxID=388357 RepID=A0A512IH90_9MICC|nr:hypothetical protein KTU01_31670 [Kocuria turfanensis]